MEKKKCNLWSICTKSLSISLTHVTAHQRCHSIITSQVTTAVHSSTYSFHNHLRPPPSRNVTVSFRSSSVCFFPLLEARGRRCSSSHYFLIHKTTAQSRRCSSLSFVLHNPFNVNYLRTHTQLIIKIFISF